MKRKTYRVGIIGAGRVGIDWHLPDIRAVGQQVVALADSVPGRAARFAALHDIPLALDDPKALIDHPEVDVVAICTPPVAHKELALAAIAAEKYVYLEKPPAMNEQEMVRIAEAARVVGRPMMVGTNNIYHPEIRALKRRIDRGEFGQLYTCEGLKTIRWRIPKGWHRRRAIGGGGVAFNSTAHRIDMTLHLLDDAAPVGVTGMTFDHFRHLTRGMDGYLVRDIEEGLDQDIPEADVEDMLMALIQFDNGVTCYLRDASLLHGPEEMLYSIAGTKGGATLWPLTTYGLDGDGVPTTTTPDIPPRTGGAHEGAWRHFIDCIRTGRMTDSPPERAVLVMRIIDALYASAEQGGRQVWLAD